MATKISSEEFGIQKIKATKDGLVGLGEQRGEEKFKKARINKVKEQLDNELTHVDLFIEEDELMSNYIDIKNNLINKIKKVEKGFLFDTNKILNDYALLQIYIFFLNENITKNETELEQDKDHIEDLKSESENYIEEIEENETKIKELESKIYKYEKYMIMFILYIIYTGPIIFFTNFYEILRFILITFYNFYKIFTPVVLIISVYYLKCNM